MLLRLARKKSRLDESRCCVAHAAFVTKLTEHCLMSLFTVPNDNEASGGSSDALMGDETVSSCFTCQQTRSQLAFAKDVSVCLSQLAWQRRRCLFV
jgi:hypothetical protein